ncbi:MAG: hypothetical protein WCO56_19845 [Verrucomicrobiota bacterium]
MPWQLIYTSAARTLKAGQSGFGTVARSPDLSESLTQRLEQLSYYHHEVTLAAGKSIVHPVICAYRILEIRGSRYHVLTRIQDAGLDYTNRTNFLAHHLVFAPDELARRPSPVILFQHWDGWRKEWREEPRHILPPEIGNLGTLPLRVNLPAKAWASLGDAGRAAGLVIEPHVKGCYLLVPAEPKPGLLDLYGESLELLDHDLKSPTNRWLVPFTNFMQAEDSPADFVWRGCVPGSPGWQTAQRVTNLPIAAPDAIRVPANEWAEVARNGRNRPAPKVWTAPAASAAPPPPKPSALPNQPIPTSATPGTVNSNTAFIHKPAAPLPPQIKRAATAAKVPANWPKESRLPMILSIIGGGILLLLLLGWWSKKHSARSAPQAPRVVHSQATNHSQPTNPATITDQPPDVLPDPPTKKKTEPPRQRSELAKLDGYATYIIRTKQGEPTGITAPAILDLITAIAERKIQPDRENVECLLYANRLEMAHPPNGMSLYLREAQDTDNTLDLKNDSGESGFRLQYQLNGPAKSVTYSPFGNLSAHFQTIVLKPPAGRDNSFTSFRLVFLFDDKSPPPVAMSKAWLEVNQPEVMQSIKPDLRQRVENTIFILGAQPASFSLVPIMDSASLWKGWPADSLKRPEGDLNFKAALLGIQKKLAETIRQKEENSQFIEGHKPYDHPLGWLLHEKDGIMSQGFWHCYEADKKIPKSYPPAYLYYLSGVLNESGTEFKKLLPIKPDNLKELGKRVRESIARKKERVGDAPKRLWLDQFEKKFNEDYFNDFYKFLQRCELEREQADLIERLSGWLDRIPQDNLDRVQEIRLLLKAPDSFYLELIKFK